MLVEDKHSISVLTEEVLYRRLKAFDEDSNMDAKTKEEKKNEAINVFVKKCTEESTLLSEEEVKELVLKVLDRTIRNLKTDSR